MHICVIVSIFAALNFRNFIKRIAILTPTKICCTAGFYKYNMKAMRLYIILLFLALSTTTFAITLPSHSFFGANQLYEENEDFIEYSTGTKIRSINMLISSVNDDWGEACVVSRDFDVCQECCDASWAKDNYEDNEHNVTLYDDCMSACDTLNGAGPSLPLGSVLSFLPFAFVYAALKRYKASKNKFSIVCKN